MAAIDDTRNLENPNLRSLPRKIDKSTLAPVGIDYVHHQVHEGRHFFWYESINLPTSGNYGYFYIQTANSADLAHAIIEFDANGYLGADFGTWTSTEADVNVNFLNNRFGSANTSGTLHSGLVTNAPTGFAAIPGMSAVIGRDGTPPASGKEILGAQGGAREEFILAANSKYVMRLLAKMNDVDVNVGFNLYEHADKY